MDAHFACNYIKTFAFNFTCSKNICQHRYSKLRNNIISNQPSMVLAIHHPADWIVATSFRNYDLSFCRFGYFSTSNELVQWMVWPSLRERKWKCLQAETGVVSAINRHNRSATAAVSGRQLTRRLTDRLSPSTAGYSPEKWLSYFPLTETILWTTLSSSLLRLNHKRTYLLHDYCNPHARNFKREDIF